jgi:hypothetical protein
MKNSLNLIKSINHIAIVILFKIFKNNCQILKKAVTKLIK